MVKDTQTIRRQFTVTSCLSVFDHFAGLALKGLKADPTALNKFFHEADERHR